MQITVKFFASLREQVGFESQIIETSAPVTIAEVWHQVTTEQPPDNLLCSRNLKYAEWEDEVEEGDEIGFFPPVTGG